MNKIKSISMFCALLSVGSAVANPILSEDKSAFQLNFPQEIKDKLSEFISSVCETEPYEDACDELPLPLEIIDAMTPCIDISFKERKSRLTKSNLVSVARALLKFDNKKALLSKNHSTYIHIALDYFLNPLDRDITCLPICSATCCSTACWQRIMATSDEKAKMKIIDEYMAALDNIMISLLSQS
jgi:hypothetical protein